MENTLGLFQNVYPSPPFTGLSRWASCKEPACQCRRQRRGGFHPWVGKIPWRRVWQLSPVFLPGESHGQSCLAGYSPWGHKKLDTLEAISMPAPLARDMRVYFFALCCWWELEDGCFWRWNPQKYVAFSKIPPHPQVFLIVMLINSQLPARCFIVKYLQVYVFSNF